jgi:hypothetical protein
MEARKYHIFRYSCIFGIILFGSLSIMGKAVLKVQGIYYPIFQTSFLFIGQSLSFLLFWVKRKIFRVKIEKSLKYSELPEIYQNWLTKLETWSFCIPGILEFIGSLLETVAYNFLSPASIVSLKCLTTIFILYYRVFHINRTVFKHQKLGLAIYSLGILLIIADVIAEKASYDAEVSKIVCICLMFIAEAFTASNLIMMEFLMVKLNTSAEVVNGMKGLTGLSLCLISYIPIGYLLKTVFKTYNFYSPFQSMNENQVFVILSVSLVIDLFFFSDVVTRTLKFSEALTVATVESGKIIIVWAIELALLQKISFLEIFGGLLIILGLLIFNEVIIIPFCGLKKSAKESMAQNKLFLKTRSKNNKITSILFISPSDTVNNDLK